MGGTGGSAAARSGGAGARGRSRQALWAETAGSPQGGDGRSGVPPSSLLSETVAQWIRQGMQMHLAVASRGHWAGHPAVPTNPVVSVAERVVVSGMIETVGVGASYYDVAGSQAANGGGGALGDGRAGVSGAVPHSWRLPSSGDSHCRGLLAAHFAESLGARRPNG